MQIERLQVVLKPRTMWESADLGTKLAMRWFLPLSLSWVLLALPFLLISFQFDRFVIQLLFLWWFKPLYERAVLMTLSILIFDGRITLGGVLKGFADSRLWFYLTFFRLSWRRSENTPIDALEDLDFNTQSQRRNWLYAGDTRIALIVSLFGLMIEAIIVLAIISLFYFLTQSDFNSAYSGVLKILNINEISKEESIFLLIAVFLAMWVSAIFYVSVGFATYIDRRTIKEGWDLELGFKKIVNRLGVLALGVFLVLPNVDLIARESDAETDAILENVLDAPEFNQTKTITVPEHLSQYFQDMFKVEDDGPTRYRVGIGSTIFAWILKFLLIGALIVALVFFFYKFYATYGIGSSLRTGEKSEPSQTVRIRALPTNLVQTIREDWSNGRIRDALALLYSAAVVYIDKKFSCDILESDTEGECLRKTSTIDTESRDAFQEVTRIWLRLAYGNSKPSDEIFESALLRFEKHIVAP
ncbi:MAG: DUF4129 domain-containing protein [Gammaproteobacteria bacterium]|nr:DUF4129 domain-containing protein [Gammaproteobacteria bacterium]